LKKEPINVALQSDLGSSKGSESEGDLSTLFLVLADLFGKQTAQRIQASEAKALDHEQNIVDIIGELEELAKHDDLTLPELAPLVWQIIGEIVDLLLQLLARLVIEGSGAQRVANLRYLNIETPGLALKKASDPERKRDRDSIVAVLKAAGLHCCHGDTSGQEE
jgi:hypothetical protein